MGLYRWYGRLFTDLRRLLFQISKDRLRFLDRRIVDRNISLAKRNSWYNDQYKNPHESKHTIGEVLRWLKEEDFAFVNSIPSIVPFAGFDQAERLFKPSRVGSRLERLIVELSLTFTGETEGGFFIIIARKK